MQKTLFATCSAFLISAAAFLGCSKAPKSVGTAGPPAAESNDKKVASENAADAGIVAALAKLPAEDRAIAEKQKVCPVSGEALGTMGMPVKLDVKGQTVFICCEGCRDKLLSNPDEYLAKLSR